MIRLSPAARADLIRISQHSIRRYGSAAAARTAARIVAALQQLEKTPHIGRNGREPGTRELVIAPFIAIYAPSLHGISVYRIIHGAMQWPQI